MEVVCFRTSYSQKPCGCDEILNRRRRVRQMDLEARRVAAQPVVPLQQVRVFLLFIGEHNDLPPRLGCTVARVLSRSRWTARR
jgi:hypothetical protein